MQEALTLTLISNTPSAEPVVQSVRSPSNPPAPLSVPASKTVKAKQETEWVVSAPGYLRGSLHYAIDYG